MNLTSFLMGFFYGFAAFSALGVACCLMIGYRESRRPMHSPGCGTEYRGCAPDCRFEEMSK